MIFPDAKVTKEGKTLSDTLNLEVVKILHPDMTRPLHKLGDEICGTHPIHGSTTGKNYCINTSKNLWYCHRCGSGGGPLEAVAVKYGLINCEKAGRIKIRGDLFKDVKTLSLNMRVTEIRLKSWMQIGKSRIVLEKEGMRRNNSMFSRTLKKGETYTSRLSVMIRSTNLYT